MTDLALVLDSLSLGLVIYDNNLHIVYRNRPGRELVSAAENPQVFWDDMRELARQCSIQQAPQTRLFHAKVANNQITYMAKAQGLTPDYDQIMVTIEDGTSTARLERTLLKAENLTVLGQLAVDALTEIRNPLTVALGFCELIAEGKLDASQFMNFIRDELLAIKDILETFSSASRSHV